MVLLIISEILGIGDTKEYVHNFDCGAWQAPSGGEDCERCNEDERFECSEYKCRSLGAACRFVNESGEAQCVDTNPNDIMAPTITPWHDVLSSGYSISPTGTGYLIQPDVEAFNRVTFGIKTDESARCKVDNEHTNNYEEMDDFFGERAFSTEKNITLMLPGGRDYTYYIRCVDYNGNGEDMAEYTIQLSTKDEPDGIVPEILGTTIEDGAYVAYGVNETNVGIFVNEPANCKWSELDEDYDEMSSNFTCEIDVDEEPTFFDVYECDTILTNIKDNQNNEFFFRCMDLVGNKNQESYEFNLRGTLPLQILSEEPNGDLYVKNVQLKVVTGAGAENGRAICGYGRDDRLIRFFETNSSTHTQQLINLTRGNYRYDISCVDVAGNLNESKIEFNILVDLEAPVITYIFAEGGILHIITDENSICEASSEHYFEFGTGTQFSGINTREHTIPVSDVERLYVRCKDIYDNVMEPITVYP